VYYYYDIVKITDIRDLENKNDQEARYFVQEFHDFFPFCVGWLGATP
jgi:hypothetical protein